MDIYHCCYKCLIVWIDWTKVRIDLFKKLHHHTCLPFSSPPPRMGVLRVGKVALHNCSKVLRGEGQEIRCCCFFPGLTIIAEAPENFAEKKLFNVSTAPLLVTTRSYFSLSAVRNVFLRPKCLICYYMLACPLITFGIKCNVHFESDTLFSTWSS